MGRYKEAQLEMLKEITDSITNADGVIKYLYFVKKLVDEKYIPIGTVNIKPDINIVDTIETTWGIGRYMVAIKSVEGKDIKQVGDLKIRPFIVPIEDETMIMKQSNQTTTIESIDQEMEKRKKTAKDELDCLEMEKKRVIKEHELENARKSGNNNQIEKITKELEDTKKELSQKTEEIRKEQAHVIDIIKDQERTGERQANSAMLNFAEKMSES